MVKACEHDDTPISTDFRFAQSVFFVQARLATGHLRYHHQLCTALQIYRDKMFGSLGLVGLVISRSCLDSL